MHIEEYAKEEAGLNIITQLLILDVFVKHNFLKEILDGWTHEFVKVQIRRNATLAIYVFPSIKLIQWLMFYKFHLSFQ